MLWFYRGSCCIFSIFFRTSCNKQCSVCVSRKIEAVHSTYSVAFSATIAADPMLVLCLRLSPYQRYGTGAAF